MSVAPLTSRELTAFAAIAHKLELVEYAELIPLCQLINEGNVRAWEATYSDHIPVIDADELERDLLQRPCNAPRRHHRQRSRLTIQTAQLSGPLCRLH